MAAMDSSAGMRHNAFGSRPPLMTASAERLSVISLDRDSPIRRHCASESRATGPGAQPSPFEEPLPIAAAPLSTHLRNDI